MWSKELIAKGNICQYTINLDEELIHGLDDYIYLEVQYLKNAVVTISRDPIIEECTIREETLAEGDEEEIYANAAFILVQALDDDMEFELDFHYIQMDEEERD